MIRFLNELIYLLEVKNFIGKEIHIEELNEKSLFAYISGEDFNPARHTLKTGIKAATYHAFMLEKKDTRWQCRVIFDI